MLLNYGSKAPYNCIDLIGLGLFQTLRKTESHDKMNLQKKKTKILSNFLIIFKSYIIVILVLFCVIMWILFNNLIIKSCIIVN